MFYEEGKASTHDVTSTMLVVTMVVWLTCRLNSITVVLFPEIPGLCVFCMCTCASHLLKVVHQSAHKLSEDPAGQWVQCGGEGDAAH